MTCKHCKIQTNNQEFCSDKCKSIFDTLNNQNLDSFYFKVGHHKISKPISLSQDLDFNKFDSLAFKEEFITKDSNGYDCSYFYISGITCSACVWLNENILLKQTGIISANINVADKKAKIIWNSEKIKVSDIIKIINSIGYEAHPYTQSIARDDIKKQKQDYISKLWVAFFVSFNIMMVDVAKYKGLWTSIENDVIFIFHMAEFLLASLAIFYSGSLFLKKAYMGIKNHIINMEFLVYFGAMLGYIYSIFVLFSPLNDRTETYFDSVAMIVSFVLLGKYLEIIARDKSNKALSNISNIPMMINKINKQNQIIPTLARLIKKNDLISIKPNEKIIIDGVIISGEGNFNTSVVNGESKAIFKKSNSDIISGSLSIDASIIYRATENSKSSFLGKLSIIINNQNNTKNIHEDNIAKISSYFGLVILLLSFITFIIWFLVNQDFTSAFITSISVIIIACPCSLALAIPISTLLSLNSLIKKNIVCKNLTTLENVSKSKYFIFDKTNTLTTGIFEVIKHNIDEKYMGLIYEMTKKSNHLISKSVSKYIYNTFNNLPSKNIFFYKEIHSKGIKARVDNSNMIIGNKKFLIDNNVSIANINTSSSVLLVAKDDVFIGYFELEDEIKKEAQEVIKKLSKQNIHQVILSGDNDSATQKVAKKLNIPYKANMSAKDKKEYIQKIQNQDQIITMIGDGLNDVLALNQSDISVSFSTSDTITTKSSDILLNNSNLESLIFLIEISKKYKSLIKQNLAISFGYNAITIPIAILGYITPIIAAISMSISSILVVLNSIRGKIR